VNNLNIHVYTTCGLYGWLPFVIIFAVSVVMTIAYLRQQFGVEHTKNC